MIIKENIWIGPFNTERLLHIYMPDDAQEGERFPVLYMFDGHNLFYDSDATYGKCWGIREYLDKHHGRVIVVGLECNHEGNERLSECTPYTYDDPGFGHVDEKGRTLIQWMITDLKNWVDSRFPTKPEREYTWVGGSSMGGTMALYMAMMNSDVYSKAVCVSPHIFPMYKQLRRDLGCHMHPETEIYISWGGYEYATHHIFATATDQNLQIIRALLKKPGVDVWPHVFKNDNHSEQAWNKELKVWMKELGIC